MVHLLPRASTVLYHTLFWPCHRQNKWYLNYIGFGQELWAPTLTRLAHLIQCVLKYNPSPWASSHGLINYKDTKAKFLHLKKFTCKGTLRLVFLRVYRLEIQSVILVIFYPALWTVAPFPCVNKYTLYTYTECKGGGGVLVIKQMNNTCPKTPLQVNSVRWRHFALPSMSLIFHRASSLVGEKLGTKSEDIWPRPSCLSQPYALSRVSLHLIS